MKQRSHMIWLIGSLLLATLGSYLYFNNSNDVVSERLDVTSVEVEDDVELPAATEEEQPLQQEEVPPANNQSDDVKILTCSDCLLAPVDKNHQLSSTYAPSVVNLSLSGGGQLTSTAASAADAMFSAAINDGLGEISVRSSYRSYDTQVATFEKWVKNEMVKGYSRAEAEKIANTYSARPGQSEHQLGTTLDILCSGCGFDFNSANKVIWGWLVQNAKEYGFVLSYPEGRDAETGYTYEPWHYRYIGTDMAEQFNLQNKTLNKWLASL